MKVLLKNGEIVEAGFDSQEGKKAFWHTSAHVLAQAVKRLYPNAKCAIGPAIDKGFYYDFEFDFHDSKDTQKIRLIVLHFLLSYNQLSVYHSGINL